MIKFVVHSDAIRTHKGVSTKSGAPKPYTLHFQTVFGHFYDRAGNLQPYPEKLEMIVDKDENGNAKAYAPGEYQLHPSSIYVDRTGDLSVAPRLVPLQKRA